MGYMVHHAIIVTSVKYADIRRAHRKASKIFPWVSEISPNSVNGYSSFFIPPDGSKEGWDESEIGDKQRETFLNWLDEQRYSDGSTSIDYACVQYGDEAGHDKLLQSTNKAGEFI